MRDIRAFFRPVPALEQQSATKPARPAEVVASMQKNATSPRTETPHSHSEASGRRPTASPAPPAIPAKRSIADSDERPQAVNATAYLPGSQSSANSGGSKKVVVNGEQMVLDSDSDSDVLVELDFGQSSWPRKKVQQSLSAPRSTQDMLATRSSLRGQDPELRKPSDRKTPAKLSLSSLVQAARKDAEAERKIVVEKADLDQPLEEEFLSEADIDEDALAGVVDDKEGEGKAKRLYLAMQRTNAFNTNCAYHFFNRRSGTKTLRPSPFPAQALPKPQWASILEDDSRRDQAFLSGFVQQIFEYEELPQELALWMVDQVCLGSNETLGYQYLNLLKAYPKHLRDIFNRDRLHDIFASMGANVQSLDLSEPVVPSDDPRQSSRNSLPPSLQSMLRLLRISAPHLNPEASSYTLAVLVRICFDDDVKSNAAILQDAQNTTERILGKMSSPSLIPMFTEVVPPLLSCITHPILQNNLIQSLPSRSPLTASFRRHLALAFLFHPMPLDIPLSSPDLPNIIHDHLDKSSNFFITRDTDYASLAARLSLLDVGIGPGPMQVPYPHPPEFSLDDSHCLVLPSRAALPANSISFNKEIDALAKHIKLLSNNIVEAGAISDLTRLEAKDCSERLVHRLENAVRIGGRRIKDGLGDEDEMKEESKKVFGKWLIRGERSRSIMPSSKKEEMKPVMKQ